MLAFHRRPRRRFQKRTTPPAPPAMGRFWSRPSALLVVLLPYSGLLLVVVLFYLPLSEGARRPNTYITAEEACADFAPGSYPGAYWTLDTCIDVWTRFAGTVSNGLHERTRDADAWRETALKLRRAGSPCLVAPSTDFDGAGSITVRHLAAWMYADELGCDWVTPDWGVGASKVTDGEGGSTAVVYCHRTATAAEMGRSRETKERQAMRRCSVMDWLSYFQFGVPSVSQPEGEKFKIIQAALGSTEAIEAVKDELETVGIENAPYDRVVFTFHPSFGSTRLIVVGNWDEARRRSVRNVLRQARDNFHKSPRPWYDGNPKCDFDLGRINVAIHVRLGDRRAFQDGSLEYFELLDLFMQTVSKEVMGKGLELPLFHVFSETLFPCPSEETLLFDEFPTWPVRADQIPLCLQAETPDDCPEKRAGSNCSPNRSGLFKVDGKPILLHVGDDVQNAMSCMIQADVILMGCSTFGQVAGLLSRGISLFSTECDGPKTPPQYKSIPPLAVAERGHLWVPVSGSWRDPVLIYPEILGDALDELFAARRV